MNNDMRVMIFTDAGDSIGYGHFSRCYVLYNELIKRNIQVEFYINSNNPINSDIEHLITYFNWDTVNLESIIQPNDYCIVDSYIISGDLEKKIASLSKKVLFIDDFGNFNHPGYILNYSLTQKEDLNNKRLLLGPDYILLKEPFASYESNYIVREEVKAVLITLGGSTLSNIAYDIIDALAPEYPDILFRAIVSEKKEKYQPLKNVELLDFCSPNQMLNRMLMSDIVITAPSQTLYEVLKLKVPFISIQTADNQANNVLNEVYHINLLNSSKTFQNSFLITFNKLIKQKNRKDLVNSYNKVSNMSWNIIDNFLGEELERK